MYFFVMAAICVILILDYLSNGKRFFTPLTIFCAVWLVVVLLHTLLVFWESRLVLPIESKTKDLISLAVLFYCCGCAAVIFLKKRFAFPDRKLVNQINLQFVWYVELFGILGTVGAFAGIILFLSAFGFHGGDIKSLRELSLGGRIGSNPLGYLRDILLPLGLIAVVVSVCCHELLNKRQKLYGLYFPILSLFIMTYITASRVQFVSFIIVAWISWLIRSAVLAPESINRLILFKKICWSLFAGFIFSILVGLYGAHRMVEVGGSIADVRYVEPVVVEALSTFGQTGQAIAAAASSAVIYNSKPLTELDFFIERLPDEKFWGAYQVSIIGLPLRFFGGKTLADARETMFDIQARYGRWENTWATSIRDMAMDFGILGMLIAFSVIGFLTQFSWYKTMQTGRCDWFVFNVLLIYWSTTSVWYSAFLIRYIEFSFVYLIIWLILSKGRAVPLYRLRWR